MNDLLKVNQVNEFKGNNDNQANYDKTETNFIAHFFIKCIVIFFHDVFR